MAAGCFDGEFLKSSSAHLVDPYDPRHPLESRARSWLHANCATCHREHAGGSAPLMLNVEMVTSEMRVLGEKPTRGDFGLPDARIIAPGLPGSSVLLHRIAKQGVGHMPMIGPHEIDVRGFHLLADWVRSMALETAAPAGTNDASEALNLALKLDSGEGDRPAALRAAADSPNPHIRELLERFLPDSQRVATLGPGVVPEKITRVKGEARRGAGLFTTTGKAAICMTCHFINGVGRDFGPDLSKVGARLGKAQIIESLLTPSKVIAPGFQPVLIILRDGTEHSGFVVKREGTGIVLKTPTGQPESLAAGSVATERPMTMSLMPEGLLQGFTAEEAADLVEYLCSLK